MGRPEGAWRHGGGGERAGCQGIVATIVLLLGRVSHVIVESAAMPGLFLDGLKEQQADVEATGLEVRRHLRITSSRILF
eukprot:4797670-Pyramimonas_sp.AAC.1